MSEKMQNIDNLFKNQIEEYLEMPSDNVWEAIENNFDTKNHIQLKNKYKNLKKIAAVLLLLLCGSMFFLISKNILKQNNFATQKSNTQQKNIQTNIHNQKPSNADAKNNLGNIALGDNTNQALDTTFTTNNLSKLDITRKNDRNTRNKNLIVADANKKQKNIATTNYNKKREITATEDEIYLAVKKITTKNKTKASIQNSTIEEDDIAIENNSIKIKPSILMQEKINTYPLILSPKIYSPIINLSKPSIIKPNKSHSFAFTIYATPEFAFNRLEDDKPHQDRTSQSLYGNRPREDRNKIRREENKTTSFSAGILVDYNASSRIILQTGIGFTSKFSQIVPKKVYAEQNANGELKYRNNFTFGTTYINPKTGSVTNIGDSAILGITKNTVQYISFPINILYHFHIGKFQLTPMVGVAANFLVKQKAMATIEGDKEQIIYKIEGVNNNYFNANIGVGIGYKLSKKMDLVGMPNLSFGLNPINKNSNVKFYSNTAGIMLGLKSNF